MAANTYVALQTQTLGSAVSSVTFSSIPQGYTDLVIVANYENTAATNILARFNGDTGSNYSWTYLDGNGTSATSGRGSNSTFLNLGYSFGTNQRNNAVIHIMNYTNTTTFKTVINRQNQPSGYVSASANIWRATPAAITSISIFTNGGNWNIGSTFSVYGIAAASVGAKATGGIISSDANYFYHTFAASGTFTPTQSLTADYLVVAGGGGGSGYFEGGGGGAGGLRCTVGATGGGGSLETALSLSAIGYTVTVGAGGAGGAGGASGSSGNNSVFSTITSTAGGFGGNAGANANGGNGGSGGGTGRSLTAGTGTANQGFAGGAGDGTTASVGGGGGAGQAGAAAAGSIGGKGGDGVATSISGSSVTYAGGGGGSSSGTNGAGGAGGGGAAAAGNATAGTANTGGGGGGSRQTGNGGTGGSGIVIVRYAK